MFASQSIIVTPSPKEKAIKKCSLYPYGFLFLTKIIIASIIFLNLTLRNPPTPVVPDIDLPTTYNVLHNKN